MGSLKQRQRWYWRPTLLRDRYSVRGGETVLFTETGRTVDRAGGLLIEVQRVRKVIGPLWVGTHTPLFDASENFVPLDEK